MAQQDTIVAPPAESALSIASNAQDGQHDSTGKARMIPNGSGDVQDDLEEALFKEINAKKAKIVQGFPLASVTGIAEGTRRLDGRAARTPSLTCISPLPVMKYIDPHYPVPLSNFPSIASGTPSFDQDPLFAPYAREIAALVQPLASFEPSIPEACASQLYTSSLDTFTRAQAQHGQHLSGLYAASC